MRKVIVRDLIVLMVISKDQKPVRSIGSNTSDQSWNASTLTTLDFLPDELAQAYKAI